VSRSSDAMAAAKVEAPGAGAPQGGRAALVRALRLSFLEDEFVLFEFASAPTAARRLPPVEARVLELVLDGCSNTEIALARRRSRHTVANEVARLFRRLGVGSRLELFALVASGGLARGA